MMEKNNGEDASLPPQGPSLRLDVSRFPTSSKRRGKRDSWLSHMQMRNYNDNFGNSGRRGYGNSNSGTGFNSKARGEQFRNRAIDGISKLDETDNLMADSMRLINDSKELGVSTLVKVDEQTEILANTKQNVDETLVMSNSAGSILNNMAYRYCANKALLWVIIVILIAANVGVYLLNHQSAPSKKPSKPTRLLQHATVSQAKTTLKQHHVAFIQRGFHPKKIQNQQLPAALPKKAHLASTQKAHSIKHELKKALVKLSSKNNRPAILNGKRLHHVPS